MFLHNVNVKIAYLAVVCSVILGVFGHAINRFYPAEPEPDLHLIDMAMRKNIRNFAAIIKTGLYIKNFETFDVQNDKFIFDGMVWFEFNTDEVMQETIDKFSFVGGKILSKSPGDIRVTDKTMLIKYDVRVETRGQLAYHRFPFDDHRLSLLVTNNYITPSEAYFTVDNSGFSTGEKVFASNWMFRSARTIWGYTDLDLDSNDASKNVKRPVVAYTINFVKSGLRFIIIIFLPLFVVLLLSLFTLLITIDNEAARFRASMVALTAMLSYRFVVDRMMPSVGYFTTTDVVYAIWFVFIFLVFVSQLAIGRMTAQAHGVRRAEKINTTVFFVVTTVCLFATSWFLLR